MAYWDKNHAGLRSCDPKEEFSAQDGQSKTYNNNRGDRVYGEFQGGGRGAKSFYNDVSGDRDYVSGANYNGKHANGYDKDIDATYTQNNINIKVTTEPYKSTLFDFIPHDFKSRTIEELYNKCPEIFRKCDILQKCLLRNYVIKVYKMALESYKKSMAAPQTLTLSTSSGIGVKLFGSRHSQILENILKDETLEDFDQVRSMQQFKRIESSSVDLIDLYHSMLQTEKTSALESAVQAPTFSSNIESLLTDLTLEQKQKSQDQIEQQQEQLRLLEPPSVQTLMDFNDTMSRKEAPLSVLLKNDVNYLQLELPTIKHRPPQRKRRPSESLFEEHLLRYPLDLRKFCPISSKSVLSKSHTEKCLRYAKIDLKLIEAEFLESINRNGTMVMPQDEVIRSHEESASLDTYQVLTLAHPVIPSFAGDTGISIADKSTGGITDLSLYQHIPTSLWSIPKPGTLKDIEEQLPKVPSLPKSTIADDTIQLTQSTIKADLTDDQFIMPIPQYDERVKYHSTMERPSTIFEKTELELIEPQQPHDIVPGTEIPLQEVVSHEEQLAILLDVENVIPDAEVAIKADAKVVTETDANTATTKDTESPKKTTLKMRPTTGIIEANDDFHYANENDFNQCNANRRENVYSSRGGVSGSDRGRGRGRGNGHIGNRNTDSGRIDNSRGRLGNGGNGRGGMDRGGMDRGGLGRGGIGRGGMGRGGMGRGGIGRGGVGRGDDGFSTSRGKGDRDGTRMYNRNNGINNGRDDDNSGRNRTRRQDGENDGTPFEPQKPREFYIPSDPTSNEDELFSSGISRGINFVKYENIPIKVTGQNAPKPISSFENAHFCEVVLGNVKRAGYITPTPIQKVAIPVIKERRDLMGCAQTGSGKTAAFLLPIIDTLLTNNASALSGRPHVLIVVPTRELAIQTYTEARKFACGSYLAIRLIYGGTSSKYQSENIAKGALHILICTPGRLLDFVAKALISFEDVRFIVLDEADRMLDMGFKGNVATIMNHPTMPPGSKRQNLMFSATFPESIQCLASEYLSNYIFIAIGVLGGACGDVTQVIYEVDKIKKKDKLVELLKGSPEGGTIVFVETKRCADFLASYLSEIDIPTTSIHGDRLQSQREKALMDLKSGEKQILIATSVAARGLDIRNVRHVVNYELPSNIDEYVHRIGRTGRVGNEGKATSFYDPQRDFAISGDLVKILDGAGQKVPDFLMKYQSANESEYNNNTFGGYDVRKNMPQSNKNMYLTDLSGYKDEDRWN